MLHSAGRGIRTFLRACGSLTVWEDGRYFISLSSVNPVGLRPPCKRVSVEFYLSCYSSKPHLRKPRTPWNDTPSLCWDNHWSLGGPGKLSKQNWSGDAVIMCGHRVTESYPCRTCSLVFLIYIIFKNSLSLYTKEKTKAHRGLAWVHSPFLGLNLIIVGLGGESWVLILMLPFVLFPQICPREEWPQRTTLQWLSLSCWV